MDEQNINNVEATAKLLNGQIRGAINKVARDENLTMINMTLFSIYNQGIEVGRSLQKSEMTIDNLKEELGIKIKKDE